MMLLPALMDRACNDKLRHDRICPCLDDQSRREVREAAMILQRRRGHADAAMRSFRRESYDRTSSIGSTDCIPRDSWRVYEYAMMIAVQLPALSDLMTSGRRA